MNGCAVLMHRRFLEKMIAQNVHLVHESRKNGQMQKASLQKRS